MSKYNNKKVSIDGVNYDSAMEAEYHKFLLEQDDIINIVLQPKYNLLPPYEMEGKETRGVDYKADFEVTYKGGKIEVIDVKGFETSDFKIKKKMFESKFKCKLKCVTFSKIDGGWIELDELKVKRKLRKKGK